MRLLFTAIYLMVSMACMGQANEPFKRANLILITFDTLTTDQSFDLTGRAILDMGYTISKSDRSFRTIETNLKAGSGSLSKASTTVQFRASVKPVSGDRIEVKLSGIFGTSADEITYRGMAGSPFMVAFEKMQELAQRIAATSESKITYALQ